MNAPAPSVPSAGSLTSGAKITEIDISRPARTLGMLRYTDYTLVVVCGFGAIGLLPNLFSAVANGQWEDVIILVTTIVGFGFATYTGWRHVGMIDPHIWRLYLWVFPALALAGLLMTLSSAATLASEQGFGKFQNWMNLYMGLWFSAIAIPGFVCAIMLRRMRLPGGLSLAEVINDLRSRGDVQGPGVGFKERANVTLGMVYSALGAIILLGTTLWPIPEGNDVGTFYRTIEQVNVLGFFLIVRARRHFQVRADALLEVDKRPPILFLRSFKDDEKQPYGSSSKALLDFSLETRLASHFHHFGPFIAIGSPKDKVPQPGAARVFLKEDEWQARVLGWMQSARLIVMYCGITPWVNWELRNIIEKGRSTSLVLLIPEVKGWRTSRRKRDVLERIQQLRDVFRGTPWQEELDEFTAIHDLRAMLFVGDGSMVMVRSRSRSRDSYHLAALVAHRQLLVPTPVAAVGAEAQVGKRPGSLWAMGAMVLAGVALALGGLAYIGASADAQVLHFKKGQLEYLAPITQAQAERAGQVLVDRGFFNEDNEATARLDRADDRYRLHFVINPSYADELSVVVELGTFGGEVARDALGGGAISIVLADKQRQLLKTIPSSAMASFGSGTIYYSDPVTAQEASASGKALLAAGFGRDNAASVYLSREQNVHHLRFVIIPNGADDPAIVKAFAALTHAVSEQGLSGQPVMMHLCDADLRTLRSERIGSR